MQNPSPLSAQSSNPGSPAMPSCTIAASSTLSPVGMPTIRERTGASSSETENHALWNSASARLAGMAGPDECNAALIAAARRGHQGSVAMLLSGPEVQVNARDMHGNTALIWAARNGHVSLVRDLLQQSGIEPLSTNHAGRDAFAAAAELGHPAMMKVLMSDPRIASHACNGIAGFIAAASAGHATLLQQLLRQTGININMRDEHGRTMLMAAAANGKQSTLRLLLEMPSIDINLKDTHGATALMLAAMNGHTEALNALLAASGIEINARNELGETALIRSIANGHLSAVHSLLAVDGINIIACDEAGNDALIAAASGGHHELVSSLLGLFPKRRPLYYIPPANEQNRIGETALTKAVAKGHLRTVEVLIGSGEANPAICNRKKQSAITIAASKRQFAILRVLLDGQRWLGAPATHEQSLTVMVQALMQKDRELILAFLTPPILSRASQEGLAYELLRIGARSGDLGVAQILLDPPLIDFYAGKVPRKSALLIAAENGKVELLSALLKIGIDVNTMDSDGRTALMHAAMNGHLDVMQTLLETPGIHVDIADRKGESALMLAAKNNWNACATLLLSSRRVNANKTGKDDTSILRWASLMRITWFVQALLDAGADLASVRAITAGNDATDIALKQYLRQRTNDLKERYTLLHGALYPTAPVAAPANARSSGHAALQHAQQAMPALQEMAMQKTCAVIVGGMYKASSVATCVQIGRQMPPGHLHALMQAVALAFVAGNYRDPKQGHELHPKIATVLHETTMHDAFADASAGFESVKCGIDRYATNGRTPLTQAASKGDTGMIDLLLALGANINLPDNKGDHPLQAAGEAAQWHAFIHLIAHGANPANCRIDGLACWEHALIACTAPDANRTGSGQDSSALDALMAALKIDANIMNGAQGSAWIGAATINIPWLLPLLRQLPGIDVNFENSARHTALMEAVRQNHAATIEALLQTPGVDVNARSSDRGRTALLMASTLGNDDAVRLLLQAHGIDVNAATERENSDGCGADTPLIIASFYGHTEIVRMLLGAPGIKVNLQNWQPDGGATLRHARTGGPNRTALMYAAQCGKVDIVKELLRLPGIDTSVRDVNQQDAEQLAMHANNRLIARLLRQHAEMQ